jgi:hypothetical protein
MAYFDCLVSMSQIVDRLLLETALKSSQGTGYLRHRRHGRKSSHLPFFVLQFRQACINRLRLDSFNLLPLPLPKLLSILCFRIGQDLTPTFSSDGWSEDTKWRDSKGGTEEKSFENQNRPYLYSQFQVRTDFNN